MFPKQNRQHVTHHLQDDWTDNQSSKICTKHQYTKLNFSTSPIVITSSIINDNVDEFSPALAHSNLAFVLPEIHRAGRLCGSQSRPSWLWRRGIWSAVQTGTLGSLQSITFQSVILAYILRKICSIDLFFWYQIRLYLD